MKRCSILYREYLSYYIEFYKKIDGYVISEEGISNANNLFREATMLALAENVPERLVLTLGEELSELQKCFLQYKEKTLFGYGYKLGVKFRCIDSKRANTLINNIEISIRKIESS